MFDIISSNLTPKQQKARDELIAITTGVITGSESEKANKIRNYLKNRMCTHTNHQWLCIVHLTERVASEYLIAIKDHPHYGMVTLYTEQLHKSLHEQIGWQHSDGFLVPRELSGTMILLLNHLLEDEQKFEEWVHFFNEHVLPKIIEETSLEISKAGIELKQFHLLILDPEDVKARIERLYQFIKKHPEFNIY